MHRAYIKNLIPFYKPDEEDGGELDINSLLFGDLDDDKSSSSFTSTDDTDLFSVPELEGLDNLSGDNLDAALAALLDADEKNDAGFSENGTSYVSKTSAGDILSSFLDENI